MDTEQRIKEIRKGTLKWYTFKKGASVLFVGEKTDPLFEMLINDNEEIDKNQIVQIDADVVDDIKDNMIFDYIIAIESLELLIDATDGISQLSNHLRKDGHLIIGFNNRLGVRYFLGDRDPYTQQNFDGIENYRRSYSKKEDKFMGKCYDKFTIVESLNSIGLSYQCFSLFPDFNNTQLILRDDYKSEEDYSIRLIPTYNNARTVFMEEQYIYNSLQNNNILHSMANSLLFDCTFAGDKLDVLQVTSNMGRDEENAFFTVIHESIDKENEKYVSKVPSYLAGKKRLEDMIDIANDLKEHGLKVVEMDLDKDRNLYMPYIEGPTAQAYFRRLAFENERIFLDKLDEFIGLICQSSDVVIEDKNDGEGFIVKKGYTDLIPLNCFYVNDEFVFIDQEYYQENYPINAVIYRVLTSVSEMINAAKLSVSFDDLLCRYNLNQKREKWSDLQWEFLSKLRREKELATYFTKIRADGNQLYSNRVRMNYSAEEYLRRFVNIFQGIGSKKVVLFGTGNYADQFMNKYGRDYDIDAVIDNNLSNQGKEFFGIKISSPDILKDYEDKTYRVIICIKNFLSVVKQLEEMGVSEYGIFDPNQVYERSRKVVATPVQRQDDNEKKEPKKYHTGYIAGVFDLFHVGHLEKFKLAKEQCDYLIVGLVSDEGVVKYKKTTPFIPFKERKELLEACRYVDEVVEIPLEFRGTRDAWKMYGFDVQFSGSDYVNDPGWLADKEYLEQRGVDMVFFPYTESVSSSKLKALIEEKLI